MNEIESKNIQPNNINESGKEKPIAEIPVLQFSVPCVIPQFFIVNRWINGIGEFEQIVKILDPDLKEVTKSESQKFKIDSKAKSADLFSGFININFEKVGVYWISVELNGDMILSYPLPVFNK